MITPRALLILVALCWVLSGCASRPGADVHPLLAKARGYYDLYAKRDNFAAFMAHYSDKAELRDMSYGSHLQGKAAIADFLNWDRGDVTLLEETALVVEGQVVEGNTVVTRGYFKPFMYQGQQMGPWYFAIWLEFDTNGLIEKQTDWINYTPKDQFLGGENLNRLISVPESL